MILCTVTGTLAGGEINGVITSRWLDNLEGILVFIEHVDSALVLKQEHQRPKVDQKNLEFIPHILPIVVGTTVDFRNSDTVNHNVFSPSKTRKFDLGSYPPGEYKSITFDEPGKVVLLCNVHPEMSAFVIVLENPLFALSDDRGHYTITDVPAGRYRLTTWHRNLEKASRQIAVPDSGSIEMNFQLKIGDPIKLRELFK